MSWHRVEKEEITSRCASSVDQTRRREAKKQTILQKKKPNSTKKRRMCMRGSQLAWRKVNGNVNLQPRAKKQAAAVACATLLLEATIASCEEDKTWFCSGTFFFFLFLGAASDLWWHHVYTVIAQRVCVCCVRCTSLSLSLAKSRDRYWKLSSGSCSLLTMPARVV